MKNGEHCHVKSIGRFNCVTFLYKLFFVSISSNIYPFNSIFKTGSHFFKSKFEFKYIFLLVVIGNNGNLCRERPTLNFFYLHFYYWKFYLKKTFKTIVYPNSLYWAPYIPIITQTLLRLFGDEWSRKQRWRFIGMNCTKT